MPAQLLEHRIGQHLTGPVPARRAKVVVRALDGGVHSVEHAQRLLGDFDADAVAGNDCHLHPSKVSESCARTAAGE